MNTYRITAYLKVTIDIDAADAEDAEDQACDAQLADWTQGKLEIETIENLGVCEYD